MSYRLLKKNWAVEILSPGTDLKTLHLHRILHDQEHPTSPTHIHWRHRTVPRSDSAGGRSRPRQVGAECFHLLVSVLVVGSTPPILGEESTALVKCWSPLSKPLMFKLSPKLPSPPDRILLFLMVIFRYREGGPASYWIHHWVIFLDKSFTMIAVTVPLSNGRSRIDYIYFMEQVLLAPKTGQSKAILSRRFALFISFNSPYFMSCVVLLLLTSIKTVYCG